MTAGSIPDGVGGEIYLVHDELWAKYGPTTGCLASAALKTGWAAGCTAATFKMRGSTTRTRGTPSGSVTGCGYSAAIRSGTSGSLARTDMAAREAELRALTAERQTRAKTLDEFRYVTCAGRIPPASRAWVLAELRGIGLLDVRIDALFRLVFGE